MQYLFYHAKSDIVSRLCHASLDVQCMRARKAGRSCPRARDGSAVLSVSLGYELKIVRGVASMRWAWSNDLICSDFCYWFIAWQLIAVETDVNVDSLSETRDNRHEGRCMCGNPGAISALYTLPKS